MFSFSLSLSFLLDEPEARAAEEPPFFFKTLFIIEVCCAGIVLTLFWVPMIPEILDGDIGLKDDLAFANEISCGWFNALKDEPDICELFKVFELFKLFLFVASAVEEDNDEDADDGCAFNAWFSDGKTWVEPVPTVAHGEEPLVEFVLLLEALAPHGLIAGCWEGLTDPQGLDTGMPAGVS